MPFHTLKQALKCKKKATITPSSGQKVQRITFKEEATL